MAFEIPAGLHPRLLPIAWMVGHWEGAGTVEHPSMPVRRFHQVLQVEQDGRPFLAYTSRTWTPDDTSRDRAPDATETGYLRVVPSDQEAPRTVELEMVVAHPTGIVEVYTGTGGEGKVELSTDLVARTATGPDYTAGKRLIGLVGGDFLWAYDMAGYGHPLTSYASAHLKRGS